jgi:hypothetical protein
VAVRYDVERLREIVWELQVLGAIADGAQGAQTPSGYPRRREAR